MPAERVDFYDIPVIYDILHSSGTAAEVDGLERMVGAYCRTRSDALTWLEPACGTGRYLRRIASRDARCRALGFDVSEPMLAYAREKAARVSNVDVFAADMTDFACEGVDVAFNLINTIRHVESDEGMAGHLACMARALKPGGIYLVGVSLSAYGLEQASEDVWTGKRGRCEVRQVINYLPPVTRVEIAARRERVVSHVSAVRPTGTTAYDSTYTLRCYSRAQWEGVIEGAGWEVLDTVDEQGDQYPIEEPGYAIWVLAPRRG